MVERSGLREDTGQVREGRRGPFPIFGTLCAKRGLGRICRKHNKSTILHLERRTERPRHPNEAKIPRTFVIRLVLGVAFPNTLLHAYASAGTGGCRAPLRYGRGSGGRTATLVVEADVRRMSPDTIAVGVVTIVGTIGGALVGLFGERFVRRLGWVRCSVDQWYVQQGAAHPDGGGTAEERRLRVTFLNRKDLPVTVWDMRVEFCKRGVPTPRGARPHVVSVDESGNTKAFDPVALPPHIPVPLGLSVIPDRTDKLRELEKADTAEFVATLVGARDKRKKLHLPWRQ